MKYGLKAGRNSNQLLLMKVISYLSPCTFTKCIEQFIASSTPGWGNFEMPFVSFFPLKIFVLKLILWHNFCCKCHKTTSTTKYACAKYFVFCFVVYNRTRQNILYACLKSALSQHYEVNLNCHKTILSQHEDCWNAIWHSDFLSSFRSLKNLW